MLLHRYVTIRFFYLLYQKHGTTWLSEESTILAKHRHLRTTIHIILFIILYFSTPSQHLRPNLIQGTGRLLVPKYGIAWLSFILLSWKLAQNLGYL